MFPDVGGDMERRLHPVGQLLYRRCEDRPLWILYVASSTMAIGGGQARRTSPHSDWDMQLRLYVGKSDLTGVDGQLDLSQIEPSGPGLNCARRVHDFGGESGGKVNGSHRVNPAARDQSLPSDRDSKNRSAVLASSKPHPQI